MTKKLVAIVEIPLRDNFEEIEDVNAEELAENITAVEHGIVDAVEIRRALFGYDDTHNFWFDDRNAEIVRSYCIKENR